MFPHRNTATNADSAAIDFSPRDREDAVRLLRMIVGETEFRRLCDPNPIQIARSMLSDRKLRQTIFNPNLFSEPAWDLLLTLYVNDQEGPRLTIGRAADFAGYPLTTALRWLNYLEELGLVLRQENPGDARAVFVRLTDKGRGTLTDYMLKSLTPQL
jgi:DNA-binding MarR family transcriptional regulator